jgi:hypothetical protein
LWTASCPISGSGLSLACCYPFCLSSLCLLKVCMEISFFPLSPSPVCFQQLCLSAMCLFSVPCFVQFFWFLCLFLFFDGGSVCPGGFAGLSEWWLGEYHVTLGVHLLVCRMSPKQVWSWHLVAVGDLLFSQCNMV